MLRGLSVILAAGVVGGGGFCFSGQRATDEAFDCWWRVGLTAALSLFLILLAWEMPEPSDRPTDPV